MLNFGRISLASLSTVLSIWGCRAKCRTISAIDRQRPTQPHSGRVPVSFRWTLGHVPSATKEETNIFTFYTKPIRKNFESDDRWHWQQFPFCEFATEGFNHLWLKSTQKRHNLTKITWKISRSLSDGYWAWLPAAATRCAAFGSSSDSVRIRSRNKTIPALLPDWMSKSRNKFL